MKVAVTVFTTLALLLCASANYVEDSAVGVHFSNRLYEAIFDEAAMDRHFATSRRVWGRKDCTMQYLKDAASAFKQGGRGILKCLHISRDDLKQLRANEKAKVKQELNQCAIDNCKPTKILDCYAETFAGLYKDIANASYNYYVQVKLCVRTQLSNIEQNLKNARHNLSSCLDAIKRPTILPSHTTTPIANTTTSASNPTTHDLTTEATSTNQTDDGEVFFN